MRRALLLMLLVAAGCRRHRDAPPAPAPAPSVADTPEATAPAEAPAENPVLAPPPPPPPPVLKGHAPTDDELRARLQPLYPEIKKCIEYAGAVDTPQDYLQLRFILSSGSGTAINAQVMGHERARDCVLNVLKQLQFEPWPGPPSTITLPLTKTGEPVPQSAFSDAGSK